MTDLVGAGLTLRVRSVVLKLDKRAEIECKQIKQ